MKCNICKTGETKEGKTTVTIQKNDHTIIIKQVPAKVCDNCGEYFLNEQTAQSVYNIATNAISKGTEVEITRYAV